MELFQYRNLFPADVVQVGQSLLCLMNAIGPLHIKAVYMILKPLICDSNAPKLLKRLVAGGYLYRRETGVGTFLGLTAKSAAYLDIYHVKVKHRKQSIPDQRLPFLQLRNATAALALLNASVTVCLKAWDKLSETEQGRYLNGRGISAFAQMLAAGNAAAIDALPRSIIDKDAVMQSMVTALVSGNIPFTNQYNQRLYRENPSTFMTYGCTYDLAQEKNMELSAKLPVQQRTGGSSALYHRLSEEREEVRRLIARVVPTLAVQTALHGEKLLTLKLLEGNGIYIELIAPDVARYGLLYDMNNTNVVSLRLDSCMAHSRALGRDCAVNLITTEQNKPLAERHVTTALRRLGKVCPTLPVVHFTTIDSEYVTARAKTWKTYTEK